MPGLNSGFLNLLPFILEEIVYQVKTDMLIQRLNVYTPWRKASGGADTESRQAVSVLSRT
jgi:hypothetical protein